MFDLYEITWFQFDNLIKGRVPFLLINLGADLSGVYTGFYQTQLESLKADLEASDVKAHVQKLSIPAHHAIVVLCPDGKRSTPAKLQLEKDGYTNVFYNPKGLAGLLAQRE